MSISKSHTRRTVDDNNRPITQNKKGHITYVHRFAKNGRAIYYKVNNDSTITHVKNPYKTDQTDMVDLIEKEIGRKVTKIEFNKIRKSVALKVDKKGIYFNIRSLKPIKKTTKKLKKKPMKKSKKKVKRKEPKIRTVRRRGRTTRIIKHVKKPKKVKN